MFQEQKQPEHPFIDVLAEPKEEQKEELKTKGKSPSKIPVKVKKGKTKKN